MRAKISYSPAVRAHLFAHWEERDILLTSIESFKGLERPVVVLVGVDGSDLDRFAALAYVGISRARSQLVVIGERGQLEALKRDHP